MPIIMYDPIGFVYVDDTVRYSFRECNYVFWLTCCSSESLLYIGRAVLVNKVYGIIFANIYYILVVKSNSVMNFHYWVLFIFPQNHCSSSTSWETLLTHYKLFWIFCKHCTFFARWTNLCLNDQGKCFLVEKKKK